MSEGQSLPVPLTNGTLLRGAEASYYSREGKTGGLEAERGDRKRGGGREREGEGGASAVEKTGLLATDFSLLFSGSLRVVHGDFPTFIFSSVKSLLSGIVLAT